MELLIRIAGQLRELQYAPNVNVYTSLLTWINQQGMETLQKFLDIQLAQMCDATDVEVGVRQFDHVGTYSPPLYYSVSTLNTVGDLKKVIAESEHTDVMNVQLMTIDPQRTITVEETIHTYEPQYTITVEDKTYTVDGRLDPVRSNAAFLRDFEGHELLTFPEDGRATWTEYPAIVQLNIANASRIRLLDGCDIPPHFGVTVPSGATVGDLKKALLTVTGAPLSEQMIERARSDTREGIEVLDDQFVLDPTDESLRMRMRAFAIPYMVSTWERDTMTYRLDGQTLVHALNSGREILQRINEEDRYPFRHPGVVNPRNGPATDPNSYSLEDSDRVLYDLDPDDARIYVDMWG